MEGGQNQPQNPPKRIKLEEIVKQRGEDRISSLPDCLIVEILSRLPSTKYAIRTGALSKRWKHVWTWVHTLIFEHSDYSLFQCRQNPNSSSDYVLFLDKTLTQCRQLKLKKLEMSTSYYHSSYDIRFKSQFNNWIRYAVSCNVEELNLKFGFGEEAEFLLDQFFFSCECFTDLSLRGCVLNPHGAISWTNLRSLCVDHGKLDEDLIENILFGSPLLETLVLKYCYGYRLLDITSKSVKNLVFCGYMNRDDNDGLDDIIEINAPNISSLTIEGDLLLWKVVLVNVSSLVEANLDYKNFEHYETMRKEAEEEMLKGFIPKLHHVKELKIGYFCCKARSRLEAKGFAFPSNMKYPEVTSDWSDSDSDW